ncbi:MAG TPA: hypothetical protein VFO79_15650 [Xanthomonadales bacterium]|nr:hypothetical protein [Xanthomonadales bacterium]
MDPQTPYAALSRAARHGRDFYCDALGRIGHGPLQRIFRNLAGAKTQLAWSLDGVCTRSDAHASAFWAPEFDALSQCYAELREQFADPNDLECLERLADAEARMVTSFEHAIDACLDDTVRQILRRNLPRVRACAEQARELEFALAG